MRSAQPPTLPSSARGEGNKRFYGIASTHGGPCASVPRMDPLLVYVILGAGAAGFTQGLSGFAFGLTAMAFWAWAVPPQLAAPMVVFGSLLGQMLAVGSLRRGFKLRRAPPLLCRRGPPRPARP